MTVVAVTRNRTAQFPSRLRNNSALHLIFSSWRVYRVRTVSQYRAEPCEVIHRRRLRPPSPLATHMHWLRVPPTLIVRLSASERQSEWF
jgi:hypothetical protein